MKTITKMKWTSKQKAMLKLYYRHYYKLLFRDNGEVYAMKSKNSAYGLLYTKAQSIAHLTESGINCDNFHNIRAV